VGARRRLRLRLADRARRRTGAAGAANRFPI